MWLQEETEERVGKAKLIIFTGPGNRSHSAPYRTMRKRRQGGQEAEDRSEGKH